jgi:hypothetical protein
VCRALCQRPERVYGARKREWQAALGRLPPSLQDRLLAVMVEVTDALHADFEDDTTAESPAARRARG